MHAVRDLVTGCDSAVGEAVILSWYSAMVNVLAMQPMVLQRWRTVRGWSSSTMPETVRQMQLT